MPEHALSPCPTPSPPTHEPVRWALVGFGSGGRIFHAPLLASAAGIDLVAVVTRNPERRQQVAESLPGVVCVDDVAQAAKLGIGGVTISTPPATHGPLARQAASLGLHAVVDKPFARSLAETREMVVTAHDAGVLIAPYFNRRWDGDFLAMRALLDSGRLGTALRFESRLDRFRPVKGGWPSDMALGGGLWLDLGPHLVDQALTLLGPVRSVAARFEIVREGASAEDSFSVTMTHLSGARSVLSASLASAAPGPRFLLQGTAAGLRIEGFDNQEAQLKAGESPASLGAEWGADARRTAMVYSPDAQPEPVALGHGRWDTFYPAVAAAIAGDQGAPTGPADALATAAVLDIARIAAQEGREYPMEVAGGASEPGFQPRNPAAR